MKLRINNRDLPYTIDTYGVFTGDSTDEGEREYYQEEYGLTDTETQDLEFGYNHAGVVEALANQSVNLLDQNLVQHNETGGIVRSISQPFETKSPQFYNYTTDSYTADWDVDDIKLAKLVKNHKNADGETFEQWLADSSWGEIEPMTEDYIVAMLEYWLPSIYETEDYETAMFECEGEAWYENMTLDAESQALIDSKVVTK